MVTSDVVRERERHALGHAAEYDRRARDAKRRVVVEVFDELFVGSRTSRRNVSMISSPLRQVSMTNAMTKAMSNGNQPPSKSFVEVEAKKTRSRTSKLPFTAIDEDGIVLPMQCDERRHQRRDRHQ